MPDTLVPTIDSPERTRKLYERLVSAVIGVAVIALLTGLAVGQQLVGAAIYLVGVWVGVALAVLIPTFSEVRFYDERDDAIYRRASGTAMGIAFVVGLSIIPVLYVLDAAGTMTITPTMWGGIYVVSALYLCWGVCYTAISRRR